MLFAEGGITLATVLGIVEHSGEAEAIHAAGVERGEALVRGLLADAIADGTLRSDLDPIRGARELFGPVTHRRLMTRTRPSDDDVGEVVDAFLARWSVGPAT